MALDKVNDTLKSIKKDTDKINKNFDSWFDAQKRDRLRQAERDREADRALGAAKRGAMVGGVGALALGAGAGGTPAGGESSTGGGIPWEKLFDIAGAAWFGASALDKIKNLSTAASNKAKTKAELEAIEKQSFRNINDPMTTDAGNEARKARIEQERIRLRNLRNAAISAGFGDIEAMADIEAEKARRLRATNFAGPWGNIPVGGIDDGAARRARVYGGRNYRPTNTSVPAIKYSELPPRFSTGISSLKSPSGDNTSNVRLQSALQTSGYSVSTQKLNMPVNAADLIPNIIESTKRVRLADVVPDLSAQAKINDIETKNNVRISVTPEGKIDIRSNQPGKVGTFVSRDVFNKTMADLTSPKLSSKSTPKIKAGGALSVAGLVLEGGFAASNAASDLNAIARSPSVMDTAADQTRSVNRGEYTKYVLANIGAIPGETVDFGALMLSQLTGKDLNTGLGQTSKQALLDILPSSYGLGGVLPENIEFGPLRQKFFRGSQTVQQIIAESLDAGLRMTLGGVTAEQIRQEKLQETLRNINAFDGNNNNELDRLLGYKPLYPAQNDALGQLTGIPSASSVYVVNPVTPLPPQPTGQQSAGQGGREVLPEIVTTNPLMTERFWISLGNN